MLPLVGGYFRALPEGAGLAGAVAELIDAPDVTEQLRAGELALREERSADAADAAARALSMALSRAQPRLGGPNSSADIGFMLFRSSGVDREVRRVLERTDARLSDVEEWVLAATLGLRPTDFARLTAVTGRRITYLGGDDTIHRTEDPTNADAAWALRQVAEIIYRLQELGAMIEGPADAVWAKRRENQTFG